MSVDFFIIILTVGLILFSVISVIFFKSRKIIAGVIFSFCFWLVLSSGGTILYYAFNPNTGNNGMNSSETVKIPKGTNARRIAVLLKEMGIISSERKFMITSRYYGEGRTPSPYI